MSNGLRVPRRFTIEGTDPYGSIEWAKRDSRITNPDGSVVFEVRDAEVPASWSQVATDIIVSKYFRKAGVPQTDAHGNTVLGSETSARQVFDRLAGTWRWWGEKYGYFASAADAQAFEDEMKYMLANQIASPNSPQWFNTGLAHAYGITGTPQGFWYVDPETGEMTPSPDSYTHPAPHACFPATARISTSEGFKAIEKVEPGDQVLTHRGRYRTVLETMQRQVEEELVSLRISKLTATPFVATINHPVLALRRAEVKAGYLTPQWVPAGDLEVGDYVVTSRPTDSYVIPEPFDLAEFAGPNFELAERVDVEIPFSANRGRSLRIGEDRAYRVQSTARVPFFGTVYNVQVEEDETYVADGVVVHNCFINAVADDLVNPGGIMDLWVREARLFKMGSGTGSNFSKIRAENEMLSGGGKSSGVMGFLRIGDRAAGAIKCLQADTEIATDQGSLPISEIIPGHNVITRFGLKHVSAVHDNGVRPLVRLTTALGDELLCTPEHRFWVRTPNGESWKEAKDLDPDDYLTLDLSSPELGKLQPLKTADPGHHNEIAHELPTVLDEAFALWLGWLTGDGSITTIAGAKFVAMQIGDEDPELLDRYEDISKAVFGSKIHIFVNRRGDGRSDASASVRFSSSHIIRFLEVNGLRKNGAAQASIPVLIKSSPAPIRAAYLSGLFEADGHLDNGYPVLSSVSKTLALDVHRLLIGLGILSKVKRQDIRTNAKGDLPIYLVRVVGGEGVRRFAKLIGFISERKSAKLDEAVTRKSASPYETQWILPHVEAAVNALWEGASPSLRRALAPYARYTVPRSLSLLRAMALMDRFPEELAGSIIDHFARGQIAYQKAVVVAAGEGRVFDLTVADAHEYTVHGLVTHNSGGTTRRAAKMVILDLDHPDVEEFIDWKKHEEDKARVLIQHGGYPADFNGEAYSTVSGQNSNNSVRVPNEFIEAVRNDGDWELRERTSGKVRKTVKARELWRKVAEAAWACADPGVQFDTIINEWHTSPAGGKIRATNPCAEYVFLDDTACNLASINLIKFYDDSTGLFDTEAYEHAIRLWTIALEISVAMAHFPSKEIAQGSYDYRTLGLGYANLGTLLMRMGLPYDSDAGRAVSGAITAILTGYAYATSAELAASVGPFPRFTENREAMLRVIRNHRRATYDGSQKEYEGLSHYVMGINSELTPSNLLTAARQSWDLALDMGERHGYRNAQVSVIAPTGTIGLQMDCDTTGVEPDFALVKFKKLAGGGYFKIVNQSVAPALRNLGYTESQIEEIVRYIVGTSSLEGAPHINRESLTAKGFTEEDLTKIEKALPAVFELKHAFNPFVLGESAMLRFGFEPHEYATFEFDLLRSLGFSHREIREATEWVCGQQTIEGAPHLRDEHLAVFDTANRNGRNGSRLIHHTGHIKMLAATQPFLSGAASKTINMPNEATIEDIEESYMLSYELGVKCMALYRDGSKASQPLSSGSDDAQPEDEPEEVTRAHELDKQILWGKIPTGMSPTQAYSQGMHPPRFVLPGRRGGYTQEARIGGHKVYLRTGEYDDGTLGEVFIDLAKEGATLRGILSCFAIAVSKGLQFGVPLEEFVDTFTFQTFEPRGLVEGHPHIKMSNSIVDYVFRALAVEYLQRDELAQVPPNRDGDLPEPKKGLALDAGVQLDLTDAVAEEDVSAVASAVTFLDRGPVATKTEPRVKISAVGVPDAGTRAMQSALGEMMGDAPLCDTCGHITIRNGACYKCLNCGNSLGCS